MPTATITASRTFIDAFEQSRPAGTQLSVWERDRFVDLSWDRWRADAWRAAAALRARGIAPGSRVGCILTNAPSTCAAAIGIWLAGGCIVSLPTIARGMDPLDYARSLGRIRAEADLELVLVEERYADQLAAAGIDAPTSSFEGLAGGPEFEAAPPVDEDIAFVQYSSGSTSSPKGCMLTAQAIGAQLDALSERLELAGPDERGVSWLPLSHDMGFFGCLLLSFAKGMRLTVGSPGRFVRAPRTWLEDCARTGATITAVPNSALDLAVRATGGGPIGALTVRKLVLGGERVEYHTLRAALAALGPAGLRAADFLPAYGLAEAVLAVTMPRVADEPRTVAVRTEPLLRGQLERVDGAAAGATTYVSVGTPVAGAAVEVSSGPVGELFVRASSLASGYAGDPALTADRFTQRGLRTGDLGFLDGDELFVVGRTDDMLCVGGRNVFASDVEVRIGALPGVRAGTPVLVEVPDGGGARLVVVAEAGTACERPAAVADTIAATTARAAGLRLDECWLLPPGAVPKTPSGKVQRFRCRQLVAESERQPIIRVEF